jgi:hypothetical protein
MRIWCKRVVALLVLVLVALASRAAYIWTSPEVVRQLVLKQLEAFFPDCQIEIGSAHVRLLGGVSINEVRIRKKNADQGEMIYLPRIIAEPDKHELASGEWTLRKLTLLRPRITIIRDAQGKWNVDGLIAFDQKASGDLLPTIVMQQGSVVIVDGLNGNKSLRVEIEDVALSILPKENGDISVELAGSSELCRTAKIKGSINQQTRQFHATITIEEISIQQFVKQLSRSQQWRTIGEQLSECTGKAKIDLTLSYMPSTNSSTFRIEDLKHDLSLWIKDAVVKHEWLPEPLDKVNLAMRLRDGQLIIDHMTACAKKMEVDLRARLNPLRIPTHGHEELCPEEAWVDSLNLTVRNLELKHELFERMPIPVQRLNRMFRPEGLVAIQLHLSRQDGKIQRQIRIIPQGITMAYAEQFNYPLHDVTGIIEVEAKGNQQLSYTFNLLGYASKQPVKINGAVHGVNAETLHLDISGENIPLNETLLKALPEKYRAIAQSFNAEGYADFKAEIVSTLTQPVIKSKYTINFHECRLSYDIFPYPLENVSGQLHIVNFIPIQGDEQGLESSEKDHIYQEYGYWSFSNFQGTHDGGLVKLRGSNRTTHQGELLTIEIEGSQVKLDRALKTALDQIGLDQTWQVLQPSGRLELRVNIAHLLPKVTNEMQTLHNSKFHIGRLAIGISFSGLRIKPRFFPYELSDLTGSLRYANQKIELFPCQGWHGPSKINCAGGEILLGEDQSTWVKLCGLTADQLGVDHDFLRAVPIQVREILKKLNLEGKLQVVLHELIVSLDRQKQSDTEQTKTTEPQELGRSMGPRVYWRGVVNLTDVDATIGIECKQIQGQISSRGEYLGDHFGVVKGAISIEHCLIYEQPITQLQAQFYIDPEQPEMLKFENIFGRFYGGDLVAEGRLIIDSPLRFEILISALQIRLEEFARINGLGADVELRGLASIQLLICSRTQRGVSGPDSIEIDVDGTFNLPSGQIARLPLLLDLLKVLNLRTPDRTAFEEAHAVFQIRDRRIEIPHIDLIGSAISLGGFGGVDIDGKNVDFEFYAIWSRIVQLLPHFAQDLPAAISQHLLKIKTTGSLPSKLDFRREAVPIITTPLKRLIHQLQREPGIK